MRPTRPFAACAIVALTVACSDAPSSPKEASPKEITTLPRTLTVGEQRVVSAANAFAPTLLGAINRTQRSDNVFVSPLSASMALGMTMNGAAGTTFDEMRTTLGFGTMERADIIRSYRDLIALLRGLDARVDFRIANSIWYRDTFSAAIEPTFLSEAKQYFDAGGAALDFNSPSALTTINGWVKQSTNGKIEKIIDSISSEIVMLLINAIYFKGDWRNAFDRTLTKSAPFTTLDGAKISVPMMARSGSARLGRLDGRVVVELGYGGDAFVMDVVLPRDGENVNALVESLTPTAWTTAMSTLAPADVDLTMPKFKLEWEKKLNNELSAMGMPTAFLERRADFTRLSSSRGRELYISYVKQKTFVDVNEVGTEAAAVTAVGVGITSVPVRTVVRVDRPFLFVIRERLSGTILFMGKIVRPTSG